MESPHRLTDPHEADPVLGAEALLLVGVQDVLQQGDDLPAGQIREAATSRYLNFQPSLRVIILKAIVIFLRWYLTVESTEARIVHGFNGGDFFRMPFNLINRLLPLLSPENP